MLPSCFLVVLAHVAIKAVQDQEPLFVASVTPFFSLRLMAEIETALPPAEKPTVVDHHRRTESVHSSKDEEASPSHEHDPVHKGNQPAPETEELNDLYDPNVYVGVLCPPLPTNAKRLTSRSDPFPVDPDAPVETHQLTIRALVIGGALGAIGKQIPFSWNFLLTRIRSWCFQHLSRPEDWLHLRTSTFRSMCLAHWGTCIT
jgi:hypothetical protein